MRPTDVALCVICASVVGKTCKTRCRLGCRIVGRRTMYYTREHIGAVLFRNSQLSTLYSTVKSRTEMTIITTVRYQGNALADTFSANRVQCLTLLVSGSYIFLQTRSNDSRVDDAALSMLKYGGRSFCPTATYDK